MIVALAVILLIVGVCLIVHNSRYYSDEIELEDDEAEQWRNELIKRQEQDYDLED